VQWLNGEIIDRNVLGIVQLNESIIFASNIEQLVDKSKNKKKIK